MGANLGGAGAARPPAYLGATVAGAAGDAVGGAVGAPFAGIFSSGCCFPGGILSGPFACGGSDGGGFAVGGAVGEAVGGAVGAVVGAVGAFVGAPFAGGPAFQGGVLSGAFACAGSDGGGFAFSGWSGVGPFVFA